MERSFARREVLGAAAAIDSAALLGPAAGVARAASPGSWPTRFPLPDGFQPEGIAIGRAVGAEGSMVNDVVLTPGAAWFTDSFRPQLYRPAPDRRGEPAHEVATVPLGGAWEQGTDFPASGIARTPDGSALLVVNTAVEGDR